MSIYLNIYDLPDQTSANSTLLGFGLGFYHTGVEFRGHEYSFSEHGVVRTSPCLPDFGNLREHLLLGEYVGSRSDFDGIVSDLRAGLFQPGAYNLVHRNCNHFSEALCVAAIGVHIPTWVNRAASIGNSVAFFNISFSSDI